VIQALKRQFRRNLAFFKLAIVTSFEYRLNYVIDAFAQPIIVSGVEIVFWSAVFSTSGKSTIGGFSRESYLSYAILAAFIARISVNWMYEFRMVEEVESGTLNTLLVRPMNFFEYYLSQFMGYKLVTTALSVTVPLLTVWLIGLPLIWSHLIPAILLAMYYLVFLYVLSFIIMTFAFHLTRIHSITVGKNLALWIFSGELLPLDLFPEPYRHILISLPFSSGVYVPVAYLSGRIDDRYLWSGVQSITLGIFVLSTIAFPMWKWGIRKYTGIGA
jgi:ABC-2 type transport system permease protein